MPKHRHSPGLKDQALGNARQPGSGTTIMVVAEPVFAPRPGGCNLDDGWVVAIVYDGVARKTQDCVFEANALTKRPIAAVPLPLSMDESGFAP